MLVVLVLAGLAVAVLARRVRGVRDRLPVPATTILAGSAAGVVGLTLAPDAEGAGGVVLVGLVTAVAGVATIAAGGWVAGALRAPVARRRAKRAGAPTVAERAVALADRHPATSQSAAHAPVHARTGFARAPAERVAWRACVPCGG